MNNKDAERLNGTIDFFLKGQYGIIKGEDGKEYFFGKKALTCKTKLVHDDIVKYIIDEKHEDKTSYFALSNSDISDAECKWKNCNSNYNR